MFNPDYNNLNLTNIEFVVDLSLFSRILQLGAVCLRAPGRPSPWADLLLPPVCQNLRCLRRVQLGEQTFPRDHLKASISWDQQQLSELVLRVELRCPWTCQEWVNQLILWLLTMCCQDDTSIQNGKLNNPPPPPVRTVSRAPPPPPSNKRPSQPPPPPPTLTTRPPLRDLPPPPPPNHVRLNNVQNN